MATIYTRATKGSALTWTEGDANITNLNNDKIEDIVEDTTPQLGGNLDVNGNSIVSTSNGNINLTPNGTGKVVLDGQAFPKGSSTITGTVTDVDAVRDPNTLTLSNFTGVNSNAVITFTGTGVSSLGLTVGVEYKIWAPLGSGVFELALNSGGGAISITDPGTITDVNYSVAASGATNGQILTYNTSGLTWSTPAASGMTNFNVTGDSGGNQTITDGNTLTISGGTGLTTVSSSTDIVTINLDDTAVTPNSYTNANITIDAQGRITAASNGSAAGIANIVEDTTPQLGGSLDVNGQSIVSTSNGNIVLEPNGTGDVQLNADTVRVGDSNANATITTNGTGDLILNTNGGTNSGSITIRDSANTNIDITPNGTGQTVIKNLEYQEFVNAVGSFSGTAAPNVTLGNILTITLTGNLTINEFTSPVSGQTITIIITQDATGGRTLTSTMKFAGGSKTLSTAPNAIDILTISYIGTTYYASLVKGYA